jgi:hypothetical protein
MSPVSSTKSIRSIACNILSGVLSIAFLLAIGCSARAGTEVSVMVYGQSPTYGRTTQSSGPLSRSLSGTVGEGTSEARASASFGELKVYAENHVNIAGSGPFYPSYYTSAEAYFRDTLTIDAPGLTGQSGTVNVKFTLEGDLSMSARGDASLSSTPEDYSSTFTYYFQKIGYGNLSQGTQTEFFDGTVTADNHSFSIAPFLNTELTIAVPFTYGTPFDVKLTIQAASYAKTQYGGDGIADAEHTVTWGGFASVLDSGANTVTNYSTSSDSGVNYAAPVPEPATAGLLMFGMAGLLSRRRRLSETRCR